jgi:2-polyprenyl-6-methoxyphenol hydroxylase-like FAD-dependent oxidoreductase
LPNPILITGAGPVGMTMAIELARYGVPVRIIDKAPQRTDKSKALVIWSRTLELLDRAQQLGGATPFIEAGHKATTVNFVAGDKTIGQITVDSVASPYAYALMLPQSDTERLLEERLQALGVTVERQVELTAFNQAQDAVTATLRHSDGREETVTAEWLVGCDGAHSTVRHTLQIDFAGEALDSDWMLADVHIENYPYPETDLAIYWHHDGILVFFPIGAGRFRVVANLPPSGADHPPVPTLEAVQAVLETRGPADLRAVDPVWLSGFRINGRKIADYRHGRVFLAGDAAHVHSPAGGQGMNTGMQDAMNLAWKLALVVHGTCPDTLLDSYSAERSPVGERVLKAVDRMTEVGTLSNPIAQTARNLLSHIMLGLPYIQQTIADTMTELDITYPHSPLNGTALRGHSAYNGPRPGERIAPIAGQAPLGAGDRPRFALFANRDAATDALLQKYPDLLDPDLRPAFAPGTLWLGRPDGYAACTTTEAADVATWLETLIARP